MKAKITPKILSGTVKAPASKSMEQRFLLAAALSEATGDDPSRHRSAPFVEINEYTCADTRYMSEAVKQLADIKNGKDAVVQCGESATCLRFLLPVVAALKTKDNKVTFKGKGSIFGRPIGVIKEKLSAHGCGFEASLEPDTICVMTGKLKAGVFKFPGDMTSQYISGMLFAMTLLSERSKLIVTMPLVSEGYIGLTLQTMVAFRVDIDGAEKDGYFEFSSSGNQKYIMPSGEVFDIEGDWSAGAFWLGAGALAVASGGHFCEHPEIKVECLFPMSMQPDREIFIGISAFGARLTQLYNGISVKAIANKPIDISVANIPDLMPVLAVLGSVAAGRSVIRDAGRLKTKESDRLAVMAEGLTKLGARVQVTEDGMILEGVEILNGGEVNGYGDHRIVMAFAIASIACKEPVIINTAESVSKSYPGFWEDFKALGGEVEFYEG